MGTNCHHRAHPLPDPTPYPTTLPSVANLLSSSRPSPADTAYYRSRHPHPPTPKAAWVAINHPSPAIISSPKSAPGIPVEPQLHSPHPQSTTSFAPLSLPSEASQTLLTSPGQDSAFARLHCIDASDQAQSFKSMSGSPSSHSDHSPTETPPMTRPFNQGNVQALSLSSRVSTPPPRLQEQEPVLAAALRINPNFKNIGSASPWDHGSNNATQQQRFNVGFIANCTSENMPSHKPRTDPASTSTASTGMPEPQATSVELPVTSSVELPTSPVTPNPPPAEDHAQGRQWRRDPSVERCPGCNEAWKRPLPNTGTYRHISPAENNSDLFKILANLTTQLSNHAKKADAMYARWKWRHSHCVPPVDDNSGPLTPPVTEPQDESYATGSEGPLYESKNFDPPSNKRKAEPSYDEGFEQSSSKVRRITVDREPWIAPPVSPSDPA